MIRSIAAAGIALTIAGCSATDTKKAEGNLATGVQNTTNAINLGFQAGQLFCGIATQLGPIVVGVVNAASNKPVSVVGQAKDRVASVCQEVGGIPVVTPPNPASVPVVAAP